LYRQFRGRTILSKKGREFRKSGLICHWPPDGLQPFDQDARIWIKIMLHPPTKASRDIDNYLKALIDLLEHKKVFPNDSQIDHLIIDRGAVMRPGKAIIDIWEDV
jgi:crossover junction endodeoxyribonuclease RusA